MKRKLLVKTCHALDRRLPILAVERWCRVYSASLFIVVLTLMVLFTFAASDATAQSRTAGIVGTVTDSSGRVIPGAKVTVTDVLTGEIRSATTSPVGDYTVLNLLYGQYTVTVEKTGFQTMQRSGLTLEIGQRLRVDAPLKVGAVTQVVKLSGVTPLLSSQSATVDQVITSKEVEGLPLVGRNWLNLATLTAGVAAPRATTGPGYASGSAVSVNGTNADMNSFTVDGIANNAPMSQNQALNPTIDSIQEFRVQTSVAPAEYGSASSQISVATRSGTNAWHGSLYEFFRNDALDARNYFDLPTTRKPPLHQNTFGGTLGAPIAKNKSFFFFSYDALRSRISSTNFGIIPSAAFMNGDFSSLSKQLTDGYGNPLPGNQVPASSINPTAKALLALYPQSNFTNPTFNYVSVIATPQSGYQWSLRVDQDFGERDQLFARVTLAQSTATTNGLFPNLGIGGVTSQRPAANIGISYTHIFSPSTMNVLRLGYSYFNLRSVPQGYKHDFGSALKGPSVEDPNFAFLGFGIAGYNGIGFGGRWIKQPDHTYNLVDQFSWIRGAHSFKVGADISRWRNNLAESFAYSLNFDGRYTGNAVADMLFGYGASASSFGGNLRSNLRRWDQGYFAQDDWRVTKTFTLNLGVRWDYIGAISDANNNLENFDFATGKVTYPGTPGYPTGNRNRTFRDLNNFAPRVGLAWSPEASPETVIRAGYGIFYVPSEGQLDLIIGPKDDPIYSYQANPADPRGLGFYNLAPIGNVVGGYPSVSAVDLHIRTPYVQEWNLTFQHQFNGKVLLQTGYIGNQGTKLGLIDEADQPRPGPGAIQPRRPYPSFSTIEVNIPAGRSTYNAWQTKLETRYSAGLSILASYTWSKAIDNNSFLGNRIFNPFDLRQDRGLSDQDVRNRFTAGWTYELPFGRNKAFLNSSGARNLLVGGWSLGSIINMESGMPFTVNATGDPANWGGGTRPNVTGDPQLSNHSIHEWFNTAAFQEPAKYTIGNERRNMLVGPGLDDWDGIVVKRFDIHGGQQLQFRGEFYNAFNHPQFNNPGRTLGVGNFGVIASANPGRIIQLALKYNF